MVVIATLLQAQIFTKAGIKGGMNISSFSGLDIHDAESKVGFIGGVFTAIELSETFYFQPEFFSV